jgi:hypothetical protein
VQNIHKNSTESSNLVYQNSTDNSEKPVLSHQLQKKNSTKNNNNDNYNNNNKKNKFQKKRTFESRLSKHVSQKYFIINHKNQEKNIHF